MSGLHETHVCRECGAEITLPFVAPSTPEPSGPELEPSAAQRTNPDSPEALALGKALDGAIGGLPDYYGNLPSHYRAHVLVRLREAGWTVERDYGLRAAPSTEPALDAIDLESIRLALRHFPTWFDGTAAKIEAMLARLAESQP